MLIDDPWFYAVAVPVVLISGISKGGLGGAAGGLAVPLLALVISPVQAAAIMLPLLCLMDLFGFWAYRRRWDGRNLAILIPGALVGTVIGALTFRYLNDNAIRLLIGGIAVAFSLSRWLLRRLAERRSGPNVAVGSFWATVSGFTSFVAHAGGPPLSVYLLPQKLDKSIFVGTTVIYFLVLNYAKILPYWMIGQLSDINLGTALALCPLAPIGIWLGLRLHDRLPQELLYRICYVMLFASGVKLIWDGGRGVW